MPATAANLNHSQVRILKTLASAKGPMSVYDLERKLTGTTITPQNLGPVQYETLMGRPDIYADSLYGQGFIIPSQQEGEPVMWTVTEAGRQVASSVKSRSTQRADSHRVNPEILDPIVRHFRTTRTYGIELYTDKDVLDIREMCEQDSGEDFSHISIPDLRIQMTNRRKQGAFADPNEKPRKRAIQAIKDFGPEGEVIPGLLNEQQLRQLRQLAYG